MAEANYLQEGRRVDFTPAAALTAGDVVQIPDGRAGVATSAIAAGELGSVAVEGIFEVAKTDSVALLQGGECRWDASADAAHVPTYNDADDFLLGTVVEDAAASASVVKVDLNRKSCGINLQSSGFVTAPTGSPTGKMLGSSWEAAFTTANEEQIVDLLSHRSVAIDSNWICEGVIEVIEDADAAAELGVGVANDTAAGQSTTIAEYAFIRVRLATDNNIYTESDDGTTDSALTDSTVDWAVGTAFHFYIDGRDPTDVEFYIDGVLVNAATTFALADGTGPLKLLQHMRKASNDTPGQVQIHKLEVRITPDI